jgi:hypothetical protein
VAVPHQADVHVLRPRVPDDVGDRLEDQAVRRLLDDRGQRTRARLQVGVQAAAPHVREVLLDGCGEVVVAQRLGCQPVEDATHLARGRPHRRPDGLHVRRRRRALVEPLPDPLEGQSGAAEQRSEPVVQVAAEPVPLLGGGLDQLPPGRSQLLLQPHRGCRRCGVVRELREQLVLGRVVGAAGTPEADAQHADVLATVHQRVVLPLLRPAAGLRDRLELAVVPDEQTGVRRAHGLHDGGRHGCEDLVVVLRLRQPPAQVGERAQRLVAVAAQRAHEQPADAPARRLQAEQHQRHGDGARDRAGQRGRDGGEQRDDRAVQEEAERSQRGEHRAATHHPVDAVAVAADPDDQGEDHRGGPDQGGELEAGRWQHRLDHVDGDARADGRAEQQDGGPDVRAPPSPPHGSEATAARSTACPRGGAGGEQQLADGLPRGRSPRFGGGGGPADQQEHRTPRRRSQRGASAGRAGARRGSAAGPA